MLIIELPVPKWKRGNPCFHPQQWNLCAMSMRQLCLVEMMRAHGDTLIFGQILWCKFYQSPPPKKTPRCPYVLSPMRWCHCTGTLHRSLLPSWKGPPTPTKETWQSSVLETEKLGSQWRKYNKNTILHSITHTWEGGSSVSVGPAGQCSVDLRPPNSSNAVYYYTTNCLRTEGNR